MSYLISLHPLHFKNTAHVRSICKFDLNCVCLFVYFYFCICMLYTWEHWFWSPFTITFSKYITRYLSDNLTQTAFVHLCVCAFAFVYLGVRHLGTLFLRCPHHLVFKNISNHGSFQGFPAPELKVRLDWDLCVGLLRASHPSQIGCVTPHHCQDQIDSQEKI